MRAVPNGIRDQRDGLDSWMKRKIRTLGSKAINTRITPDIGAISAMFAERDVINVRLSSRLKDKNKFVLRSIERSHPAIIFGPDADIFKLAVGGPASLQDFFNVPPVHALEMD